MRAAPRLADHTTLRLGGPARRWVEATDEATLLDAVRRADGAGTEAESVSMEAGDSGRKRKKSQTRDGGPTRVRKPHTARRNLADPGPP